MNTENELMHYGTLGMKWGVRLYQYKNGSLTPEGKEHYRKLNKSIKQHRKNIKALEINLRNKADIAAPAQEKVVRAEEVYKDALAKNSKRSIFDTRSKREGRAKALRLAEYNLNEAKDNAKKSRALLQKAMVMYNKNVKETKALINEAKEKYGKENVRDIEYETTNIGETLHDLEDYSFFKTRLVSNAGYNIFGLPANTLADIIMEQEKRL